MAHSRDLCRLGTAIAEIVEFWSNNDAIVCKVKVHQHVGPMSIYYSRAWSTAFVPISDLGDLVFWYAYRDGIIAV